LLDADGWYFPDREKALSKEFGHEIATLTAQNTLATNEASTDAASVVFAHSIVDDVATMCCKLSSLADPQAWKGTIQKKQVSLGEMESTTYDALFTAKLSEYIEKEVSRKSLVERADVINGKCQPSPPYKRSEVQYVYDRDRLSRLDRLRHEIVHDVAITKGIPQIEEELRFLESTSEYFMWSINQKYKVSVDVSYWINRNRIAKDR